MQGQEGQEGQTEGTELLICTPQHRVEDECLLKVRNSFVWAAGKPRNPAKQELAIRAIGHLQPQSMLVYVCLPLRIASHCKF
jgi:hypothetical protein